MANPENTVESQWYAQAAEDTFHVALCVLGALAVIAQFGSFTVPLGVMACEGLAGMVVVFGTAYAIRKHLGS